jgi:transcriptional regulator with XRE-family HTH domain
MALRMRRIALGLNQLEMAERAGTHQSNISAWEIDKRLPSFKQLPKLAEALQLPLDVLASYLATEVAKAGGAKAEAVA